MPVNVRQTQKNLLAAGYDPKGIDGIAGKGYYTALLAHNVRRFPDPVLSAIGGAMAAVIPVYGWDASPDHLAEWIAQTANETGGYTVFQENMAYSAKRIVEVWPSRFKSIADAAPYAWDPSDPDREDIALANEVYGERMGNEANGTADNDGWDHRGGGLIQHTGAAEYAALLQRLGFTPDDVRNPAKGVIACCDFLLRAKTAAFVARGDFVGARKSTNGGAVGLKEVAARRARSLQVIV